MAKIVGLIGLKGSGKDTVADHLVAARGYTRLAFADPMREQITEAFDVPQSALLDRATKEVPQARFALARCKDAEFVKCMQALAGLAEVTAEFLDRPRSPREVMQVWGTEYRRGNNPAYWVDLLFARLPRDKDCVITDVRFLVEADRLRQLNGVLLRIRRPSVEAESAGGGAQWAHASEQEQARIVEDAVLLNEENKLQELYAQADKALGYFDVEMA